MKRRFSDYILKKSKKYGDGKLAKGKERADAVSYGFALSFDKLFYFVELSSGESVNVRVSFCVFMFFKEFYLGSFFFS